MNSLNRWALTRSLAVVVPLTLLNWIGIKYHIYGIIWWWDVLTHYIGGIFIGFVIFALLARFQNNSKSISIINCFIIALMIILGWEIYEFVVNMIIPTYIVDYYDTVHDIINGMLGWFTTLIWYQNYYLNNHE